MIELPHALTAGEIRLLQEYRRLERQQMSRAEMSQIIHPARPAEDPAAALTAKGFLALADDGEVYVLTERATEFLSYNPAPAPESEL